MNAIAEQLPSEIAAQLHPDRRRNELEYWSARDRLLDRYRDQWIGFADGGVIAAGNSPVAVLAASEATGKNAFFICVGHESEPFRIRRIAFPYDPGYAGESLPSIRVGFRSHRWLGFAPTVSKAILHVASHSFQRVPALGHL